MTKAKLTALAVGVQLVTGAGALGAGKYTKKESEIQATQTALTKPKQAVKDEKKRPDISAEDVFGGVGEQLKLKTDAQIKVLQRLIQNTSDTDPEKPDYLFRMAEHYAENQRYYNFKARELDEKVFTLQSQGKNAEAEQYKKQQADYQKKEHAWLLAAVKQYLEVADHPDRYGSYKRMDEVLFYLAYLLTQVKKEDAARIYFKRLIKDYPKSKFIPDAYLSFGEYFFDNKDLENALKFYEMVLKFPDSRVFGYAKYKTGWCYYNLGDFKGALAVFIEVIEMTDKGKGAREKANRMALQKEAKKDVVRAYSQIGTPDKAWDLFRRVGGEYAPTMMEILADQFNAQGKFPDSIKIYRKMMELNPSSPKLCQWQYEVLRNTLSITGSRATADTVKELQRLTAVYDTVKDSKTMKADLLEECRDAAGNTLRELATVWHKEAQKTNNNDTYALAQYLYREYLKTFPKEKDIYVMSFYYAELLFKLGANGDNQKYCEAGPAYTDVVKLDTNTSAKYLKEAAYAAVISWKNCLSVEDSGQDAQAAQQQKRQEKKAATKGGKDKPAEDLYAKKEIPDRWKKMLEAFAMYLQYVPESKERVTIMYREARVYYEYNHLDEAIPRFKEIALKHQDSDLAVYSANLLLDCYAMKKDYDNVEQAALAFQRSEPLMKDEDFKKVVAGILASVTRKKIENYEETGKFLDAGKLYLKLAEEHPDDPKIDEVYYNCAVNMEKARLIGVAIKCREQLIKVKPDSTLAKKAVYLIGRNFQDIASYEQASERYETFSEKWPGEKEAPTALNTAAFFRRGLGQNDKAITDTRLFVKNYGARKEFIDQAAGVAFSEGQIYENAKDWDKVRKHFADYLKTWGSRGGVDRQVVAHVKLGELAWKQSCAAPGGGINGACIQLIRTRAGGAARVAEKAKKDKKKTKKKKGANLPPQCGPETKSKITVHERKPAIAKEALSHFSAALSLWKGGAAIKNIPGKDEGERTDRAALAGYYAAQARMMQGDAEYEKFLNMRIPDKLDFTPPPADASPAKIKAAQKKMEESKKIFKTWLENKTKQLQTAQKVYQDVILFKQAHWAIAASARIGQLFQDFSGQLFTAPVPKAGPAPPGMEADEWEQYFHDAYCDQMVDSAEPLESKAIEGLGTCLGKSTELSWFNEWSSLCEAELNQIKPAEYPLASEIRAEPGYSSAPISMTATQSESK